MHGSRLAETKEAGRVDGPAGVHESLTPIADPPLAALPPIGMSPLQDSPPRSRQFARCFCGSGLRTGEAISVPMHAARSLRSQIVRATRAKVVQPPGAGAQNPSFCREATSLDLDQWNTGEHFHLKEFPPGWRKTNTLDDLQISVIIRRPPLTGEFATPPRSPCVGARLGRRRQSLRNRACADVDPCCRARTPTGRSHLAPASPWRLRSAALSHRSSKGPNRLIGG